VRVDISTRRRLSLILSAFHSTSQLHGTLRSIAEEGIPHHAMTLASLLCRSPARASIVRGVRRPPGCTPLSLWAKPEARNAVGFAASSAPSLRYVQILSRHARSVSGEGGQQAGQADGYACFRYLSNPICLTSCTSVAELGVGSSRTSIRLLLEPLRGRHGRNAQSEV